MKVVSVTQMKTYERLAIEKYGIPGIILMENAGLRSADFISAKYSNKKGFKVLVVCGRGNNAGDGFVVARHLLNRGYSVQICILANEKDISKDALTNLLILKKLKAKLYFKGASVPDKLFLKQMNSCNLIIDAIFGIGLCRKVEDPVKSYILAINNSYKPVVALDVPSGLNADTGRVLGVSVKAKYTLTMGFAKKGFFICKGPEYVGKIYVIDIGSPVSVSRFGLDTDRG